MPVESFAPVRDAYDFSGPARRVADPFQLALATFQKADRELESLGRAVNRAEDAACDPDAEKHWGRAAEAAEQEVEAAERRWWRQYRRAHAAALNVLRTPIHTPEAARHKWEIIRRYFEGGDARSSKALLRASVTSGCFTVAANAPMESRDDQWLLAGRPSGRAQEQLGYELHLDGDDWIVLHDGVEEARYVRADEALAHARQGLRDQGKDEWSFRLGFRGR